MNAHTQPHGQGHFQGPMSSQLPTATQPRGQLPTQQGMRQAGLQTSQSFQNPYVSGELSPDTQMVMWSIRRPVNGDSWGNAIPRQDHTVSQQDLSDDIAKFQRGDHSVRQVTNRIKSESARKLVNDFVKERNQKLFEIDPTIQWAIGSIELVQEIIKHWPDKGKPRLKRIDIILKTEPRPLADVPRGVFDARNPARTMMPNTMGQDPFQMANTNAKMNGAQTQKNNQQFGPNMGNNQHMDQLRPQLQGQGLQGQGQAQNQGHRGQGQAHHNGPPQVNMQGNGHPPPPPPIYPGQQQGPQIINVPPPPPPGGPSKPPPPPPVQPHPMPPQQPQPQPQQPMRAMPGAFPEPPAFPPVKQPQQQPHQQQRVQPIEILDPRFLQQQKSNSKSPRRDYRDESGSGSETDSGSSGNDSPFRSHFVEDGYVSIERSRSRGRKRSSNRSHSRNRIRSRSQSLARDRVTKPYKEKRTPPRDRAGYDSPSPGKHASSPKTHSPRPANDSLPSQNIFNIRIDNDNDRERERNNDRGRDSNNRTRDARRGSQSISPTGHPTGHPNMAYRKQKYHGEPMSRNSSLNGSDTGSSFVDNSSSIYSTSSSAVFSEPDRIRHGRTHSEAGPPHRSRPTPRPYTEDAFVQPPYQSYDRLANPRYQPNDYPQPPRRDSLYDDHINPPPSPPWTTRPHPNRRNTQPNPFDSARFPPRPHPQRSTTYADPYDYSQPRYIAAEEHDSGFNMHDLAEAVEYIQQSKRQSVPTRRSSIRRGVSVDTDEWANPGHARYERYPPSNGFRYV